MSPRTSHSIAPRRMPSQTLLESERGLVGQDAAPRAVSNEELLKNSPPLLALSTQVWRMATALHNQARRLHLRTVGPLAEADVIGDGDKPPSVLRLLYFSQNHLQRAIDELTAAEQDLLG